MMYHNEDYYICMISLYFYDIWCFNPIEVIIFYANMSGYAVRLQDGSGFCGRTEELNIGMFWAT